MFHGLGHSEDEIHGVLTIQSLDIMLGQFLVSPLPRKLPVDLILIIIRSLVHAATS